MNYQVIFEATMFIILGLGFALYGVMVILLLKIYHKSFYKDSLCILILATLGLSLPVTIAGIFRMIDGLS